MSYSAYLKQCVLIEGQSENREWVDNIKEVL